MQESPHHGDQTPSQRFIDELGAVTETLGQRLGATGHHPQGALTPDDEGELRMAVTAHGGKVIVSFGKPVAWLGLRPRDARQFATMLSEWADKA